MSLKYHLYYTGSEDAVTVQAGTFSWDRNEAPVLKRCVCVCANFVHNVVACGITPL